MFIPSSREECDALLRKCYQLVNDHNAISYCKVIFNKQFVKYNYVDRSRDHKDLVAREIASFYEWYATNSIAVMNLRMLAKEMTYSDEDISFHFDRSPERLVEILASLTEIRNTIVECQEKLASNIAADTDAFVSHVGSIIQENTQLDESVETLFACMAQKGLDKHMSGGYEQHRPFIEVGFALLREIARGGHVTPTIHKLVEVKNKELKDIVLGSRIQFAQATENRVQRFGIVPDERNNESLHEVLAKLFGVTIAPVTNILLAKKMLANTMRMVSAKVGVSTGLIVVLTPTDDIYFNLSPLLHGDRIVSMTAGVTKETVAYFDMRYEGNPPRVKNSETMLINVDPALTEQAFVLWTNDYETFKVRTTPLDQSTLAKVLREAPSVTIANYNAHLASKIVGARTMDAVSYNFTQYMSFMNEVTEKSFLDDLQNRLLSCIKHKLLDKHSQNLTADVTSEAFTHELYDTIDSSKAGFGVPTESFPTHSHVIFAAMANKIVQGIKKHLLQAIQNHATDDKSLTSVIEVNLRTNDNIYTRIIARYHLQQA